MANKTTYVTRTIETVIASVMVCDTETGKTEIKQYVLTGREKNCMKEINHQLGENEVAVKITGTETEKHLYGLDIKLFMEQAVLLDKESEVADNE